MTKAVPNRRNICFIKAALLFCKHGHFFYILLGMVWSAPPPPQIPLGLRVGSGSGSSQIRKIAYVPSSWSVFLLTPNDQWSEHVFCVMNIGHKKSCTVCPRSSDQFYIVTYYINWVATSWTNGSIDTSLLPVSFIYFFLGFLGRMSMVLQMMPSITSSAPPPIEFRRMSLNNGALISNLIFIFATARQLISNRVY